MQQMGFMRARPESLVISGAEISASPGGLLRVFGWYDNEWGFANRTLDVSCLIGVQRRGGKDAIAADTDEMSRCHDRLVETHWLRR